MKYFFNCLSKCGQYETTETTFVQFVPKHLLEKLTRRGDAAGTELEFKEFCPKCQPVSPKKVFGTLHILWPKK